MKWDQSDQGVLDGIFQVEAAGQFVDDPHGPPPSAMWLWLTIAEVGVGDRKDVWFTADDSTGQVTGWYRLRLPDTENQHVGFLALAVHPEHRRHGIGTALLRHAAQRAAADGRTALAGEALEATAGEAFAKRIGAKPGVLEARRVLDVTVIPPGKVAALRAEAAAAAAGYSLASWTGPVPEERLEGYAYVRTAMNDAPSDYEDERWDVQRVLDKVNPRITNSPRRRYTIIATHDATGQTAAFTEVDVIPDVPGWAFQDNTGVARPHRGHRLGLLTKTAMLEWLASAEPDVRKIGTWNAAINDHMIGINERLGFEVARPWVQDYEIPVATVLE